MLDIQGLPDAASATSTISSATATATATANAEVSTEALTVTKSEAKIDPEKLEKAKEMIEKMDAKRTRVQETEVSSSCCSTFALCKVFTSDSNLCSCFHLSLETGH